MSTVESLIRRIVQEEILGEDVRKRGNKWCAYVDDKLTKAEKARNPKKYKGKKVGSVQKTPSGKIRMKARACYASKKKANNAMAAAMMETWETTWETSSSSNGYPHIGGQRVTERLTESRMILSEGMMYHINNDLNLDENVYRPGTTEFFDLFNEARDLYEAGLYLATDSEADLLETDIGRFAKFGGEVVPLDFPMWDEGVNEAKYKGREVQLGTKGAKRSGGRAHVYVRDPKSGKVKKISFGSGMPDAMGDSPKHRARRKSFAARHGCSKNKNKMSASYWACRSTKMFGRNVPGFW
jgi:hypothetical protein